jgi:hypothetical protein
MRKPNQVVSFFVFQILIITAGLFLARYQTVEAAFVVPPVAPRSLPLTADLTFRRRLSSSLLSKRDENEQDPRAFRRRIRREKLERQLQRNILKTTPEKRQQGEEASAAMDLPEQPKVKTLAGGTSTIFEMAARGNLFEEQPTVPRWHAVAGISSQNPSFRTQSPAMDATGYAKTIWRNARKRSKPAMWRYALRTFDRMTGRAPLPPNQKPSKVEPETIHFEGALLACSKLGLSERALETYRTVQQREAAQRREKKKELTVQVTENMILSVVRACVRDAVKNKNRAPLDKAVDIVRDMEAKHDILLCTIHVNPIAAGYQRIGLNKEADALINSLQDRVIGPESETGEDTLNIYNVQAKDKASYSLLVTSAVNEEDWCGAVDALRDMTESGLYPVGRHLSAWSEIAERKSQQRTANSWKKKRDQYFVESSVRQALRMDVQEDEEDE